MYEQWLLKEIVNNEAWREHALINCNNLEKMYYDSYYYAVPESDRKNEMKSKPDKTDDYDLPF